VEVAIGIDSHKSSLQAAAVDPLGRVLDEGRFANDPKGHAALAIWVKRQAEPRVVGIEGALGFGAAAGLYLLAAAEDVREVPATLTYRERRRQARGKSDPIDAIAIARVVAQEPDLPSAKRTAAFSDLKLLVDYRQGLIYARTRAANQAHADLVIAHPGYEQQVKNLRSRKNIAAARAMLRGDRSVRGKILKLRLGELGRLQREILVVDTDIKTKVAATGTNLTKIAGVGPIVAARILGEVGNPRRIRSKAAFAMICGTAPIQASSGQTARHRLNRRGNRKLNWALHYVALSQSRTTPEAKAYIERSRAAGKTHKEAMRCLKRHLSNVVYRQIMADARRIEEAA